MSELNHSQFERFEFVDEDALTRPVPDMDELRQRKIGYGDIPIDTTHPKFDEPLVSLASYGIAGQGYYSRPNAATGEAVPDAPTALHLRKSVAGTLAQINSSLAHPAITNLFGGEVELYVEDALRPVAIQRRLHDELIPKLLRKNHPGISEEEVTQRVQDIIAIPSTDPKRPSPHSTGGVLDIILRYKQETPRFIAGVSVLMGHTDGETSQRINPDYFEQHWPANEDDRVAQQNRRAYYAIMTGAAFGVDTGLVNNPTEWWHWGSGDQLSAKVRGEESAYYSIAGEIN